MVCSPEALKCLMMLLYVPDWYSLSRSYKMCSTVDCTSESSLNSREHVTPKVKKPQDLKASNCMDNLPHIYLDKSPNTSNNFFECQILSKPISGEK